MKKCLVTGGAGFIGSHIVERLVERGDTVRVLDNFSSGKKENLETVQDQIEIVSGDLRNETDLKKAVKGIDLIFHQAAFVSVPLSIEDPDQCFQTNVAGTINLLSAAVKAQVKRVVLASSAAVYGDNPAVPLVEAAELDPLSPYAASKRVGEIYAGIYSNLLDLEVVALRYFNVYGPKQNPDSDYAAVIPIFIKNMLAGEQPTIYGDGLQSRDFIFIADVVRANLLASESNFASGRTINICSGSEINLLQLTETLSEILGRDSQPDFEEERPGDIYRSSGNPSLAREILNFETLVDLPTGLRDTVNWMADSPLN
ncbi:MAG: SDR family oxidoreductase [Anaerolineales bacterium]